MQGVRCSSALVQHQVGRRPRVVQRLQCSQPACSITRLRQRRADVPVLQEIRRPRQSGHRRLDFCDPVPPLLGRHAVGDDEHEVPLEVVVQQHDRGRRVGLLDLPLDEVLVLVARRRVSVRLEVLLHDARERALERIELLLEREPHELLDPRVDDGRRLQRSDGGLGVVGPRAEAVYPVERLLKRGCDARGVVANDQRVACKGDGHAQLRNDVVHQHGCPAGAHDVYILACA